MYTTFIPHSCARLNIVSCTIFKYRTVEREIIVSGYLRYFLKMAFCLMLILVFFDVVLLFDCMYACVELHLYEVCKCTTNHPCNSSIVEAKHYSGSRSIGFG